MSGVHVRPLREADVGAAAEMRAAFYTSLPLDESRREVAGVLAGATIGGLPWVLLVAEESSADAAPRLVGFAELSLRSHADDCDPARPVGFLEGWWVDGAHRRRGVGRALVLAAFEWARALGCTEFASDAALANDVSRRAHAALGFAESQPVVHFRRRL